MKRTDNLLTNFTGYFLSALLLFISSTINSQNKLDSIQVLQEVTVTARTFKEVIPAQTLSGEELQALNSFSVADAIRYFSGVQLKDYGGVGGLKTVNIRSMGSNQIGVFYNGIQLGNAQNGQVDLGKFSMDNIEEISLYNGQRSQIFQSARDFVSASSIYFTSRKPRFKGGKTTNVRVNVKAGSFDLINPSILMEHKIDDNISMSFNGEWINSSGKYKVHYKRVFPQTNIVAYDTTATRQNGDINASRMEVGLYGRLPEGSWMLNVYNYTSDRGVPGAVVNNVWRRGERIRDENAFIQGNIKTEVNERWSTLFNFKYAADYTHFEYFEESLYPVNNKYRQKELYLSTANLFPIARDWDVSLSYDFQWNKMDADFGRLDDYDMFAYPSRYSNWLAVATAYNWQRLKVQASAQGIFVHETVKQYPEPEDRSVFTPAVFSSFRLLSKEELNLRAFYKKIFRMATFNEMYYVEMVASNVKPEYATQYNVGLKYTKTFSHPFFRNIDAQVDIYYNEVKDKIISRPKSPTFKWTTQNLGYVEIRGLDVSVANLFEIDKVWINTKLQYTYQKAQDYSDHTDTFYGDQIPYIPWHSGSVIASAGYKEWILNYSFIYTGERYDQSDNIVYNHVQPWYTHDISLIRTFKINKMDFKATAEVNNLLSQDYEVIFNYPMPKRNFRFSLVVEF